MKLALVYPDAGYSYGWPLSLLFLGSWIKDRIPLYNVRIIDAQWEEPHHTLLVGGPWSAVGITAMTCQYEAAVKAWRLLLGLVKKLNITASESR